MPGVCDISLKNFAIPGTLLPGMIRCYIHYDFMRTKDKMCEFCQPTAFYKL